MTLQVISFVLICPFSNRPAWLY